MKLRIIAAVLTVLLVFSLCACNNNAQPSEQSGESAVSSEESKVEIYGVDGLPPVGEDLKLLYTTALSYVNLGNTMGASLLGKETIENAGVTYKIVKDVRFSDLAILKAMFSECFTNQLVETLIAKCFYYADEKLYYSDAYTAPDPRYAGHIFRLVSQNQDEIVCEKITFIYNGASKQNNPDEQSEVEAYTGTIMYDFPKKNTDFTQISSTVKFIPSSAGWRIDEI